MKIKLAVVILALSSAPIAVAQTTPIKVLVSAESNAESQHVADRLSGQIGSSSRYALVTESGSENILLGVDCLSNTVGDRQIGVSCYTDVTYWPVPGVTLYWDLAGYLAEAGNESDVAQSLFDVFVEQTSDEKLNQAAVTFKKKLNSAIATYPKGVASLHQKKKSRFFSVSTRRTESFSAFHSSDTRGR